MKITFLFWKSNHSTDFFLPHQGLFVFSHPKCGKRQKKRRPCLPELLIPIGYICSSKKVKAQQSQTIHKITASPIFISTQLLLILLYYLPYFSKKNIFWLISQCLKIQKKVSLDVIKLKWDFFKVFGTEFLLQWIY